MGPRRPGRRISKRVTLLPVVNYAESTFLDCFGVEARGRPGHPDPQLLTERLSQLNQHANKLGFVSLLDACLAEARQRDRNGPTYQNIENFVTSGCLDELLSLFGKRNQ